MRMCVDGGGPAVGNGSSAAGWGDRTCTCDEGAAASELDGLSAVSAAIAAASLAMLARAMLNESGRRAVCAAAVLVPAMLDGGMDPMAIASDVEAFAADPVLGLMYTRAMLDA